MVTHPEAQPARCRALLVLAALALLAACAPRRPEAPPAPAVPPPPAEPGVVVVPEGAKRYFVDPDRSVVTIRVYRAGPLARLGHNHVVTSGTESGTVWTGAGPAGSGFELQLPVSALVVDDPAARQAAGPEFAGEVPQDAREGTRRNMLRPEVLDAEVFPEIIVRADALGGTWEAPVASARMTLRDRTLVRKVPLTIVRSPEEIVARGTFRVLQSEFGITPFSVAGGAIQVADELDVGFEIRAVAR